MQRGDHRWRGVEAGGAAPRGCFGDLRDRHDTPDALEVIGAEAFRLGILG